MLTRLKSLELHGYKTFADQTRFEFPGAITAIVGPNGSGKSNIADALRWVLGEQSYSLLRGKKTDDMIFYGSEQRPRASMASATITFDNSDGWLPIDFSEVAVMRRAYRDGQNEYLLNGQKVRLKEITELLAQSGLAERTYTIIGQGLIDTALALKPDERRKLFEEAAGIGLYRARKEETLHRLETTRRNIERVQDILAELQPRLTSLERQARKAQEYEQIRADLRMLLRDWYGYHWHRAQGEVRRALSAVNERENRLVEARHSAKEAGEKISSQRNKLQACRSGLTGWYTQTSSLNSKLEEINRQMAVLDERAASLNDQMKNQETLLVQMGEELKVYQQAFDSGEQEKNRLASELDDARKEQDEARKAMAAKQSEREDTERELKNLRNKQVSMETEKVRASAHHDELSDRLAALKVSEKRFEEQQTASRQILKEIKQKISVSEQQLLKTGKLENTRRTVVEENQAKLAESQNRLHELETDAAEARNQLARIEMQLEVLKQAEQSLSGYAEGARRLMQAARDGKLFGVRQTLVGILDVDPEYENAVTGALGEFIDIVLLDKGKQAAKAISIIEEGEEQRAAIMPVEWANAERIHKKQGRPGVLGVASDFVRCPVEYQPVVKALLDGVIVVKDGKTARALLIGQPASKRVVTMRGELYCANGPILVGKGGRGGIVSRPHRIRELTSLVVKQSSKCESVEKQLEKFSIDLDRIKKEGIKLADSLAEAEQSLKTVKDDHQKLENEAIQQLQTIDWLDSQKAQIGTQINDTQDEINDVEREIAEMTEKIVNLAESIASTNQKLSDLDLTELKSQAVHWDKKVAVAALAFEEIEKRVAERRQTFERAKTAYDSSKSHLDQLKKDHFKTIEGKSTEIEERDQLKTEMKKFHQKIDNLESEMTELEKSLETLQQTDDSAQQALTQAERFHAQAQLDLTRQREGLDLLRRRIEDDFGLVAFEFIENIAGQTPLPFEGIVEQLKPLDELPPELEENINRQKGLLRRMGAVNLEAQEEYNAVRERYDFLTAQINDLHKADTDLLTVIAELDDLMKKAFQGTFSRVADEFHHMFARLFPGGHAHLTLTDDQNVIDSGIDIEARLPGRREQGLLLLSGGERSLTASALVFALLKVSPTPFCVLDEVDAMLDEANITRFSELLAELSENTQFVVITHNRNTIQVAGVIYGVTIGRDSTSRVISLKMDEITDEYIK